MPVDFAEIAKQYGVKPLPNPNQPQPSVEDNVVTMARKYGVDEHLARSVAKNESAFKPDAISGAGARGVMQLMPGTAKDMGVADPMNSDQSIEGGVKYLKQLQDRYGNDWQKVAQAYHAGMGNVDAGNIGPATQSYVTKVLKDRDTYAGGQNSTATPTTATPTTPTTSAPDFAAIARSYGVHPITPSSTEEANRALTNTGLSVSDPKGPVIPKQLAQPPGTNVAGMRTRMTPAEQAEFKRQFNAYPNPEGHAMPPQSKMDQAQGLVEQAADAVNPLNLRHVPAAVADWYKKGPEAIRAGPPDYMRVNPLTEAEQNIVGAGMAAKGTPKPTVIRPATPPPSGSPNGVLGKAANRVARASLNAMFGKFGGMVYDFGRSLLEGEEPTAAAPTAPTPKPAAVAKAPREVIAKPTRSGNRVPDPAPVQPTPQPIRSGNRIPDPPPAAAPIPIMRSGNRVPDVPPTPAPIQPVRSGNRIPDAPPATPIAQTLPPVPSNNRVPTMVPEPPPPVEVIPTPTRSGNRTPDTTKPVVKPIPAEPTPGPGSVRGKGVSPTWSSGTGPTPTEAAPTPAASPNRSAPTTPIPTTEKVTKPDAAKAAQDLADEMGVTTIEPTNAARVRADKRAITTVNSVNKQIREAGVKGAKELTLDEFKNMSPKEQKAIMDRLNEIKGLAEGGVVNTTQAQKPAVSKRKVGRFSKRGIYYGPPPVPAMRK